MFQRHGRAGVDSCGIARSPLYGIMSGIERIILPVFVHAIVARPEARFHCSSIDKHFKCRPGLAFSRRLVVFPMVEIDIAHPCLYVAGGRLHGQESAMHEARHVADRVHRAKIHVFCSKLIIEHFDTMGHIQIAHHRVGVVRKSRGQSLISICFFRQVLNKPILPFFRTVVPRILVAPIGIEVALHLLHLFCHGLFRVFLHL